MKLVTYERASRFGPIERIGVLQGDHVIDLTRAYTLYLQNHTSSLQRAQDIAKTVIGEDMLALVQGGSFSLEAAQTAMRYIDASMKDPLQRDEVSQIQFSTKEIRLRPPLQPVSIRDTLNCELHFKNSLKVVGLSEVPHLFYERPYYYRTSHTAIAGPEDEVPWPSFGEKLDYELEFAAVIGKQGTSIPAARAHEYIAGYTIFNDISIRDYQRQDMSTTMGPSKCKNFTHGNILGPCIVTSDDIDPSDIRLQARVNGEVWSDSRSTDMYYSFAQLIEFISKEETLYPGEIICSGTMAFGCGLEMNRFLKPNDQIELEVEGIGVLRNQIVKK